MTHFEEHTAEKYPPILPLGIRAESLISGNIYDACIITERPDRHQVMENYPMRIDDVNPRRLITKKLAEVVFTPLDADLNPGDHQLTWSFTSPETRFLRKRSGNPVMPDNRHDKLFYIVLDACFVEYDNPKI